MLFAAPESDADGAAGRDAERFDDAHGFEHNDTAGGVVRTARAAVP
ncbi:hypothetical protein Barb7_03047 [Bacteroidales bacterium Barb7]|nr:hypothetical protein Barb7_03047 [Bacteroidales bacterium Barb7]